MTIDSGRRSGPNRTGSGYAAFSTILWNGDNTATNVFYLDGMTLAVVTSYTLTLDRAAIGGGYLGNSLVGDTGIFSTDATDGVHIADTTSFATVESNCELDHFQDFTNADGGEIDVAAGVNTSGTGSTENFDAFTNDPGGTVFIGATSVVNVDSFENDAGASVTMDDRSVMNASYFVSEGNLTLNPSTSSGDYTLLTNLGGLYFGQGSMTQLGTPDTAGSPPNFLDGIDLNGHNVTVSGFHEYSPTLMEYVPGAVFNNDGFVVDWAGSATLTIDGNSTYHGAEYKGEGFSGVTVNTENNGYVLAGDCPGTLNFADLTVGAGGVDKEQFQIDNATGRGRIERLEPSRHREFLVGGNHRPQADGQSANPVEYDDYRERCRRLHGQLRPDAIVHLGRRKMDRELHRPDRRRRLERIHRVRHQRDREFVQRHLRLEPRFV